MSPKQPLQLSWTALVCALAAGGGALPARALDYALADGSDSWPSGMRDTIRNSMEEAVASFNRCGVFDQHVTANYNAGVPTAQGNISGWIDFGHQYNTRTALHEIAHTLGVGTYQPFNDGTWRADGAASRLLNVFDGQGAVISTGGTHFWPYGLNYDNEDGPAARERHCQLVAALRFDMGMVADSDHDALPDDWESFHFKDLQQTADGDPDGDGIRNLDEYHADTDPALACPVRDGHVYVLRGQISDRLLTLSAAPAPSVGALQRSADTDGQRFRARYVGEGYFRLQLADGELVLETPGTDTSSGRPLQLATQTSAFQQQWRFAGGPGAKPGYVQVSNRETGRVLDALDGKEGAAVQLWPFHGQGPQQLWKLEEVVGAQSSGAAGARAGASGSAGHAGEGGRAGAGGAARMSVGPRGGRAGAGGAAGARPSGAATSGAAGEQSSGPQQGDDATEVLAGNRAAGAGAASNRAPLPLHKVSACSVERGPARGNGPALWGLLTLGAALRWRSRRR